MGNFEGKVALITGAAHGIGKGIAEKFAAAGANTVIVDYNPETGTKTAEEITEKYVKSLFVQADVSNPDALVEAREKVFKEFGRIDFLVLNAGVAFANKMNDISFEEWNKTLSINLTGLFNTVKAFYNDFLTNEGSIVIAPRLIDTGEMMRVNYPTQESLDAVIQKIPVRRFGTIEDVANLAIFLADPANSYIQGQTILMDGGRTIA